MARNINSISIRENAKKDHSPKWENAENWSGEQFAKNWHDSMNYYNLNFSNKDLKPKVVNWMSHHGYDKKIITAFKNTKDYRCSSTMGGIAACLLRGMPPIHKEFNKGRNSEEWLKTQIAKTIAEGKFDENQDEVSNKKTIQSPVPTIQDRVREQAINASEEIDKAIDSWVIDPEKFDPKSFKILSILRSAQVKSAHARFIKSFFEYSYAELTLLASGNADEQLREAYNRYPRKHIKKLIEFYELIMNSCDQFIAESKIVKKPKIRKTKPAEELVKKLKFKKSDDKLGLVSVSPSQIIGAQNILIYNSKTRKIGYYIAKSSEGFGVKGTSILNFTEKSTQKTVRAPGDVSKALKENNTQRRIETWFAKEIKTVETKLTGRFNEDILILRVYK